MTSLNKVHYYYEYGTIALDSELWVLFKFYV